MGLKPPLPLNGEESKSLYGQVVSSSPMHTFHGCVEGKTKRQLKYRILCSTSRDEYQSAQKARIG